jgi:3',5'-cyclic-AMP phosphodiesterase
MKKNKPPVRIIQITDPHILSDQSNKFKGINPYQSLKAVVNHIKSSSWDFDMIIATGDLTQDNNKDSYENFYGLLQMENSPIFCVPGNHDTKIEIQSTLPKSLFFCCEKVIKQDWLIIGIDSSIADSSKGFLSKSELEKLELNINTHDHKYIMIYLHHHPIDIGSRWIDEIGLENKIEFFNLLEKYRNIRVIFCGHIHQSIEMSYNNIEIIGTPSTCRQFKPKSEEFSIDDRPPGYRRIQLYEDGSINTEVIWLEKEISN